MKRNSYVIFIALIASLGGLLFGFDTAVISGAEKTIQELYDLNSFWHGFTIAIALIGTLAGALLAGKPADAFGRKRSLIIIAVLYTVAAIGTALSHTWPGFVIYRFIGGLSVGASSVIGPMYIAEIAPARLRGRLVGLFQLNIVSGILLSYFSNYLISRVIADESWRWMLGIQSIPAALFFFLLFIIPDSPRWLVLRGRAAEAGALLKKLGSENPVTELGDIVESVRNMNGVRREVLFSPIYRMPVMLAILIAIFNQMTGINAVMYYSPRIFEMVGFAKESALLQSVSVGVALLIFTVVGMTLIDRAGRKYLLLAGSVGMVVFLGLIARVIFTTVSGSPWMVVYMTGFIASFAFTQGTVIWVFISEIFPNSVRAKGQTLGSSVHWTMAAVISWLFPVIAESSVYGGGVAFSVFSFSMIIQFIVVWKIFPETRGKTLEAIQEEFVSISPKRSVH
jgi:sugar porter (SP) family MFS transporter